MIIYTFMKLYEMANLNFICSQDRSERMEKYLKCILGYSLQNEFENNKLMEAGMSALELQGEQT